MVLSVAKPQIGEILLPAENDCRDFIKTSCPALTSSTFKHHPEMLAKYGPRYIFNSLY